jgi:hypothetical protein
MVRNIQGIDISGYYLFKLNDKEISQINSRKAKALEGELISLRFKLPFDFSEEISGNERYLLIGTDEINNKESVKISEIISDLGLPYKYEGFFMLKSE